jgi:hypothetical protein
MLNTIFESTSDLSTFQVVKLDTTQDARSLSDELNNSSVQSDMVLVSQNFDQETKQLVLIFVSNTKTRMEGTGELLKELMQMSGFDDPVDPADEEGVDLDGVEKWLREQGLLDEDTESDEDYSEEG